MSCLFLPVHSSYDQYSLSSKNYEPHAFYRKHFWCFPHLERSIYTSCLLLPAHSSYDRYSLSSKNYEPHAFYRKHFWCFPHLERRIYTYLVCFFQCTLAKIDIPFRAGIMNRTRFIESISGDFSHLERRIYTYIFCFCQRTRTRLHSKVVYCWLNEMHELRIERSVNTHGKCEFFP